MNSVTPISNTDNITTGSTWLHVPSDQRYTVIALSNVDVRDPEQFPTMVTYSSLDTGGVYSRSLISWVEKFIPLNTVKNSEVLYKEMIEAIAGYANGVLTEDEDIEEYIIGAVITDALKRKTYRVITPDSLRSVQVKAFEVIMYIQNRGEERLFGLVVPNNENELVVKIPSIYSIKVYPLKEIDQFFII